MSITFEYNKPIEVAFKYDGPKEMSGKNGKYWTYGVIINGVDDYLNAAKGLMDILSMRGALKGKTLRITKHGEFNGQSWRFTQWAVLDPAGVVPANEGIQTMQTEAELQIKAGARQANAPPLGPVGGNLLEANAIKIAYIQSLIIEKLQGHRKLFGDNFSSVVNVVLMETMRKTKND